MEPKQRAAILLALIGLVALAVVSSLIIWLYGRMMRRWLGIGAKPRKQNPTAASWSKSAAVSGEFDSDADAQKPDNSAEP